MNLFEHPEFFQVASTNIVLASSQAKKALSVKTPEKREKKPRGRATQEIKPVEVCAVFVKENLMVNNWMEGLCRQL